MGADEKLTDAEFEEANRRGAEMRRNVPWGLPASYLPAANRILVRLSTGLEIAIPVDDFSFLVTAKEQQRSRIELWGAGYEGYVPELDEGIWLPNYLLQHAETSRWLLEHPEAA